MSRKFNTKKFLKDVLNDKCALVIGNEIILDTKIEPTNLQRTAIQSVAEMVQWFSFGTIKKMAGSSHTLICCLSKLRSSLEEGKKQLRVWLQYVCGVTEMLLYPSLGAPLVFPWSPIGDSEMARNGLKMVRSGVQQRGLSFGYRSKDVAIS